MQVTWQNLLAEIYGKDERDADVDGLKKRTKRAWIVALKSEHPYQVVKKALEYFTERSRKMIGEQQSELARVDGYAYKRLAYGIYPPGLVKCGYRRKWKISKIRHSNFVTYALKQMYYYPAFHYDCVEKVAYLPERWEYLHYKNWQLLNDVDETTAIVFSIEGFGKMYSTVLSKDIEKIAEVPMSLLKVDYEKMQSWLKYPRTVHMVKYFGNNADVSIEKVDATIFDSAVSYIVPSYVIRNKAFENLRLVSWHIDKVKEYREYNGNIEYAVFDARNLFGKGKGVISPMSKLANLAREVNLRERYLR